MAIDVPMPLEMPNGQLQNIGLLEFRVLRLAVRRARSGARFAIRCVRCLGRLQDQRLQNGQALIDTSATALLHQWFVRALDGRQRRRHGRGVLVVVMMLLMVLLLLLRLRWVVMRVQQMMRLNGGVRMLGCRILRLIDERR